MLRESKVIEQMELLGITDITTPRQSRNGTVVWRLPIKDADRKLYIEVASFKSGYVRNQGKSTRSNYQLNKCEKEISYHALSSGDYRKYVGKTRVLIPIEIDRLEYLISYCLKNYYIKRANEIANGDYVPKWRYDNLADAARLDYDKRSDEADSQHVYDCGHYDRITDLENKLQSIIRTARH